MVLSSHHRSRQSGWHGGVDVEDEKEYAQVERKIIELERD